MDNKLQAGKEKSAPTTRDEPLYEEVKFNIMKSKDESRYQNLIIHHATIGVDGKFFNRKFKLVSLSIFIISCFVLLGIGIFYLCYYQLAAGMAFPESEDITKSVNGTATNTPSPTSNAIELPTDCAEVYSAGNIYAGVYLIQPLRSEPFQVYCKNGYTFIMRRFDGSQNFYLYWADYKEGFGDLTREHWLGNDKIHYLTSQRNYMLKMEHIGWSDHKTYTAEHTSFSIEAEHNKYRLHSGKYISKGWWDALKGHNGKPFSTRDQGNDEIPVSCAKKDKAAYWFAGCYWSLPTGPYKSSAPCMSWFSWKLCASSMTLKLKPFELASGAESTTEFVTKFTRESTTESIKNWSTK